MAADHGDAGTELDDPPGGLQGPHGVGEMALQGVEDRQPAGAGEIDVGRQPLHVGGGHRLAKLRHRALRVDVDDGVFQRRLHVQPAGVPGEADAEEPAVGGRRAGRVLDFQRLDEADAEHAALNIREEPQEPLAVAVQPADGLLLPLGPAVDAAELVQHRAAVV